MCLLTFNFCWYFISLPVFSVLQTFEMSNQIISITSPKPGTLQNQLIFLCFSQYFKTWWICKYGSYIFYSRFWFDIKFFFRFRECFKSKTLLKKYTKYRRNLYLIHDNIYYINIIDYFKKEPNPPFEIKYANIDAKWVNIRKKAGRVWMIIR